MAFKGSLKEASLADVCQLLSLGMKTGCLSVTDRARFGQIFFDRGRITYARIVNRRDRLGDMLVRDGLLTHEQLREVLDEQEKNPEQRLGELLLQRGLIREDDVERFVRRQIEGAIYHLFTWTRGNFFFEAGQKPDAAEMLFAINAESLLLEAARRIDEWTEIERKVPSIDSVFDVDRERVENSGVHLTPEQRQILPLLDGSRSVQDIVNATGLLEFDAGHAVYGLVQAGFAREVGRGSAESHERREPEAKERRNLAQAFFRASMLEDAEREFRRVLELSPSDASARLHLGLIALRNKRPLDAIRELKTLIQAHGPGFVPYSNLALALQQLGRDDDALLVLKEAEKMRPRSVSIPLERGIIALRRQQIPEARLLLEEARQRNGDGERLPARYYYFAGLAAALAGAAAAARTLSDEGLTTYPESAPLLLLAGLLSERRGELETAESHYTQVVELDPSLVQAYKDLGDVAYRRGAHEHALYLYQRAAELAPQLGDDLYAKLGNLHYRARNREAAIHCWRRALELNPKNDAVRNNLDIVAHAAGS
jgi:tetratricopeptide (TPR) repeat protein